MGCLGNFCGGNSIWWILILVLILGNDDGNCNTCESLIWILLLSKFCCGEGSPSCGCGCGAAATNRSCGCGL